MVAPYLLHLPTHWVVLGRPLVHLVAVVVAAAAAADVGK